MFRIIRLVVVMGWFKNGGLGMIELLHRLLTLGAHAQRTVVGSVCLSMLQLTS